MILERYQKNCIRFSDGLTIKGKLGEASVALVQILDWHKAELERVIGEDVPNGEVIRSTNGTVKGHIAGSYYVSAQNELRAEQRKRAGL